MSKIIGNTTATPMAIPDWNQTDDKKADYIKNKPEVYNKDEIDAQIDALQTELDDHNHAISDVSGLQNALNDKAASYHTHPSSQLTGGYMDKAGYIDIHPEGGQGTIPFIHNDIAFVGKKGGSYKYYYTTSTNYTALNLTEQALTINDHECMFDATPCYASIKNENNMTTPIVIDITLHNTFYYATQFYIDFGVDWWSPNGIAIYTMNSATSSSYVLVDSITDNSRGRWLTKISDDGTGFNKIRVVLSNYTRGAGRIAQIGLINYASKGVAETYISRGGCEGIYGDISPYSNESINLGASSKKYANVYAKNFVGTASNAEKDAEGNIIASKPYVDSAVAQKAQVQIITWEDDD